SWSALLPWMMAAEIMDISPWHGWQISNGENVSMGPMVTPAGRVTLERLDHVVTLRQGDAILLETSLPGRMTQIEIGRDRIALTLPEARPAGAFLRTGLRGARGIAMAQQGGTALLPQIRDGLAELPLIAGDGQNRLVVLLERE